MPNAFTPNNDDLNDTYYYKGEGPLEVLEFRIYNRWGGLVHDAVTPWDGMYKSKPHPTDVLVYLIRVDDQCEIEEKKGDLTLLR